MKARLFFIAAAFAALTVSCAEELKAPEQAVSNGPRITATMESTATRAAFADSKIGNYAIQWEVGDLIKVSNVWSSNTDSDDVSVQYKVVSVSDDGVASFEMVEGQDLSRFSADSTTYYAYAGYFTDKCGYVTSTSGNEGMMKGIIGTTATMNANSIKETYGAMAKATIAADGSLSFDFKNVLCYLKLTMPYDCSYKKIRIPTGLATSSIPTGFACIGWDENGLPCTFKRTSGGSANATWVAAEGTFQGGKTYYFPIWPGREIAGKALEGSTDGSNWAPIVSECNLTTKRGTVINLGSIPNPEVPFTVGAKINIAGEGVADIDKDHHMTWLTDPKFDYQTDRATSAFYADFAWVKNDAGNTDGQVVYNTWTCSNFDYEIFVKLIGGKDVYFVTDDATPVYIHTTGNYTWKGAPAFQAKQMHALGKTTVEFTANAIPFQVAEDGVYRIRFNATTKEAYVLKIGKEQFSAIARFWPGPKDIDITERNSGEYLGHGVWTRVIDAATEIQVNAGNGKCGYKFLFGGFDDDQPYGREYGVATPFEPFKADSTGVADYWKMVPVQGGIWGGTVNNPKNGTWQLADDFYGKKLQVTIYMNDKYGAYCHSIVAAEE